MQGEKPEKNPCTCQNLKHFRMKSLYAAMTLSYNTVVAFFGCINTCTANTQQHCCRTFHTELYGDIKQRSAFFFKEKKNKTKNSKLPLRCTGYI